jgi:hypothetical protein
LAESPAQARKLWGGEIFGDLKGAEIVGRLLFAGAFAAVGVLFAYLVIDWFASVHG